MTNVRFTSIFVLLVLFTTTMVGQMHQKKGGNIGVSGLGGLSLTHPDAHSSKKSMGSVVSLGITRSFRDLLFPEINYSFFTTAYGINGSGENTTVQHHAIGIGLPAKLNFYTLRLGKSNKGECTLLRMNLLLGYYYLHPIKNKTDLGVNFPDEHIFEVGLGVLPQWSGGHKSRVAWSYFMDMGYRLDLNKNAALINSFSGWKTNGVFIRLTIIHYKTMDFLGGNTKKPAYKQKM